MVEKDLKWDAKLYQDSSSYQFKLGLMSIERLNPKNGEEILEIGSGNAMVTIELAKKISNGKIIGIEISKEMTEQARENLSKYGISNVEIINMDALNIEFNNQFDVVLSNSAIHWIKNLELMYKLIYNSLKENGRIMVQTNVKAVSPIFVILMKSVRKREYRQYFSDFSSPWRFLSI